MSFTYNQKAFLEQLPHQISFEWRAAIYVRNAWAGRRWERRRRLKNLTKKKEKAMEPSLVILLELKVLKKVRSKYQISNIFTTSIC